MEPVKFGRQDRFELAIGWVADREPRERAPLHGGSSLGDLQISVGGQPLTLMRQAGSYRPSVRWYLLPVFEWLAANWMALLHEQQFPWREDHGASAAQATAVALRRFAGALSDPDFQAYSVAQTWWRHHGLRAADASALYPDLFLRRLGDDIEVSWTAHQPLYAPDGFRFALASGVSLLPVSEVAQPLWQALEWVAQTMPVVTSNDRSDKLALAAALDALRQVSNAALEERYLSSGLLRMIDDDRRALSLPDESIRMHDVPVLEHFDSAVVMFGGIRPDIGAADVRRLLDFLASNVGRDDPALESLVDHTIGFPISAPHEEGYDLADRLLERIGGFEEAGFIDIRAMLAELRIRVEETHLATRSIRGVAIAGATYASSILINRTSDFNASEEGRRFTLAHEFFHVLFDRSRARRVAHSSTPWAPAAIEKRANAFAAMLLMPNRLIDRVLDDFTIEAVSAGARRLRVGRSALIEHLYNIGRIDEVQRQSLRASCDSPGFQRPASNT